MRSINADTIFKCHINVFVAVPDWGINMLVMHHALNIDSFQSLGSHSELSVIFG